MTWGEERCKTQEGYNMRLTKLHRSEERTSALLCIEAHDLAAKIRSGLGSGCMRLTVRVVEYVVSEER